MKLRFQQGKIQVNHNRFLGYTKDEEGNLVIKLEKAIIRKYLEGSNLKVITDGLIKNGILTATGK